MHNSIRILSLASLCVATPSLLQAQVAPLQPFPRVLDLLVADSGFNGVWRLADFDQDGTFNGVTEVNSYYDSSSGSVPLSNPSCLAVGLCGTAFVGDSTTDVIAALIDLDGNGDAQGPGEHRVFFDNTNVAGIVMASVQGLTVDALGDVFAAVSNAGSTGIDVILRLSDLNGDGDANDLNEAIEYCIIPNAGGSVGASIPTDIRIGPDAFVYYTDVGTTGALARGIYRLEDLNFDGDCNDAGEHRLYWAPAAVGNAFYWGLEIDATGAMFVTDHGNEQIWRGFDANGDGVITTGSEDTLYYQTAASTWWDIMAHPDGSIYVCEDQTPDRITRLVDLNGDFDALDPNEASEIYDSTLTTNAVSPRAGAFLRGHELSVLPGSVAVGQNVTFRVSTSRPGDLLAVLMSIGLLPAPIPVPPFGDLEAQPALLLTIINGSADANCDFALPLTIPNDVTLSGTSWAFQAIAGSAFRLQFSNGAPFSIQ